MLGLLTGAGVALAQVAPQMFRTYGDGRFNGKIGETYKDSIPAWPALPKAKPGSPNVVIFLLDDVGFGNLGAFGGPIHTPNIDRLATEGLRYNNYTTTALCSPTRAAILTGRNHHSVGFGALAETATGFPGYNGQLPKSAATLAEILKENGYSTCAVGKWHNTPLEEASALGPFDHWPTVGWGFEHFYGFIGGEADQWNPELYEDTHPIDPPTPHRHLTTLLADQAIGWIQLEKSIAPDRPFFLWFATGAGHAPHQAPREFIENYKGQFDKGWDQVREETLARQKSMGIVPANTELAPRAPGVVAWTALTPDQRRLYARMMEVYAGYVEQADYEFGRVLEALAETGQMDNTLIIVASDNGASAEAGLAGTSNEQRLLNGIPENQALTLARIDQLGTPLTYNHYPAGWAQASNTPLKYFKQTVHYGGIRDPLIIHWPKVIRDKGAIRHQFCHVIDIMPTILDVTGIKPPAVVNGVAQMPIQGASFAASFTNPNAPNARHTQYYEMLGNRGIWHDGWKAVVLHGRLPWQIMGSVPFDNDRWELYHVDDDFAEIHNVASDYPDKVKELKALWWEEAHKNNVPPLDDRLARLAPKPSISPYRRVYVYRPGAVRIPGALAPDTLNRSYSITATVEIPPGGAQGMLVTQGGRFGGFGWFMRNGYLIFVENFVDQARYTITSPQPVPAGKATLRFEFHKTGPFRGTGMMFVNGQAAGQGLIEHTNPFFYSDVETFDIGRDTGTPVAETYQCPFAFSGEIERVVVELKNDKGPIELSNQARQKAAAAKISQ